MKKTRSRRCAGHFSGVGGGGGGGGARSCESRDGRSMLYLAASFACSSDSITALRFLYSFRLRSCSRSCTRCDPSKNLAANGDSSSVGQLLTGKPFFELGRREITFDHGAVAVQTDAAGIRPISEQESHGTKQDALARSRLARENVEPLVEVEFDLLDEGVVVNADATKHHPSRSSYD